MSFLRNLFKKQSKNEEKKVFATTSSPPLTPIIVFVHGNNENIKNIKNNVDEKWSTTDNTIGAAYFVKKTLDLNEPPAKIAFTFASTPKHLSLYQFIQINNRPNSIILASPDDNLELKQIEYELKNHSTQKTRVMLIPRNAEHLTEIIQYLNANQNPANLEIVLTSFLKNNEDKSLGILYRQYTNPLLIPTLATLESLNPTLQDVGNEIKNIGLHSVLNPIVNNYIATTALENVDDIEKALRAQQNEAQPAPATPKK